MRSWGGASLTVTLSSALLLRQMVRSNASEPVPFAVNQGKWLSCKPQRREIVFRYGVAMGKGVHAKTVEMAIKKMAEWLVPEPYHIQGMPSLAKWLLQGMLGGPTNPPSAPCICSRRGRHHRPHLWRRQANRHWQ
jgi:hypothetical protein